MPARRPTRASTHDETMRLLALRHDWVLSRTQLASAGINPAVIAAQVRARRWRVVGAAVVLHRGPLSLTQRHRVAVTQTHGRGGLAGLTALEVAGLRGWPSPSVHLLVPRGCFVRRVASIVVHQSRRFDPLLDLPLAPGPPRTSAARAAIDAAAWAGSVRTAGGLLAAVVQQRIADAASLERALTEAGQVRHAAVMRSVLHDVRTGSDSLAEADMVRLIRRAGLPEPTRQVARVDARGRRRLLDLVVDLPGGTLVIEVEGGHHLDVRQAWADQSRQNDLAAPDTIVLRFSTFAIKHESATVVEQLQRGAAALERPRSGQRHDLSACG